eukprot:CAMPEP_0117428844 /NCGR_PEP_ID=MMETSP0758-20121206/8460_1 /TAXON_ID=63605 /ORGANISM="Percolomonas cosmopolitus, Strain AE-1 (ATCC 50343)" /LENGTH=321 /DNA_ID=CAMNT_0005215423 /DNA_START=261 /DNA_END=1222 /DNA_ORIENTATION=+
MTREELIELALEHNLVKSEFTKITTINLRERLMRYKAFGETPFAETRTVPEIVPKKEVKKLKRWGHRFMVDPNELKRWPQAQYVGVAWRTSVKKLTQTTDFIRHMSIKEAMDQLLLTRTRNNSLTFRFLRRCMKQCEHNFGWDEADVFIKEAYVTKRKFHKKIRRHAQGRYGIQHVRRVNLIITLTEWQREYDHEKIGKFGWRPETWERFESNYAKNIEKLQDINKEEMNRAAAFEKRLAEEKQKELKNFVHHFTSLEKDLIVWKNKRNFKKAREELNERNAKKPEKPLVKKGQLLFGHFKKEELEEERYELAKKRTKERV